MKRIIVLFALSLPLMANAQLLFPESFVVIFDTTRHFKGSVSPSLEIKTQRQLYLEVTNRADMAFRFKNHGITVANKFELTRDGSETILSGGFIYGKFKTFYDNPFVLEHYARAAIIDRRWSVDGRWEQAAHDRATIRHGLLHAPAA